MIRNYKQSKFLITQVSKYIVKRYILIALTVSIIIPEGLSQILEPEESFSFWTVGNSTIGRFGDWYPMYSELEKDNESLFCLLNELAGKQATMDEIFTKCSFEKEWLNNAVDSLLIHNFIGRLDEGGLYSKIPIISHNEMQQLQIKIKPIAERVAEYMDQDIIGTIELYNNSKHLSDPKWEDISHTTCR